MLQDATDKLRDRLYLMCVYTDTYSFHCLASETEGSGMFEKEVNAFSAALPSITCRGR